MAVEVREAMLPWFDELYGNPSGGYRFGKDAKKAINGAREQVASLIEAQPEEIIFTSGGTESNNTAIRSAISLRPERRALVTSTVEHSAVDEVVRFFEATGYEARFNPVDSEGNLDLDAWSQSLEGDDVAVASLMWANNETGVLSPMEAAADAAKARDVYFHTDAVQALGKVPVSVKNVFVHALSLSAHKFHGPKGVGALYLNRNSRFAPQLLGGGQEGERRSGTENVAGIVGMGVAAVLAERRIADAGKLAELRDYFEAGVINAIEGVEINGEPANRLPNTSNLSFPGVDGEGLLILLDEAGICCSPGSACSTGAVKPSRIIKAMGFSSSRARSSVRFSLSHLSTREEIDEAIPAIQKAVRKLLVVLPGRVG